MAEIRKNNFNKGIVNGMYYFRDSTGNEVDLVLEQEDEPIAIEIKSANKFSNAMLKGIHYWQKHRQNNKTGILLYGGNETQIINEKTSIVSWNEIGDI
jgi:predicted AAA+ superfamily ATPase